MSGSSANATSPNTNQGGYTTTRDSSKVTTTINTDFWDELSKALSIIRG